MGFDARLEDCGFEHARRLAELCDFAAAGPLGSEELDADNQRRGLAVFVLDPSGRLLRANLAARRLIAARPGDPLGRVLFTELLPATNSRLFRGLFQRAEAEAAEALYFPFTLVGPAGLRNLAVYLRRGSGDERWLFVAERAALRAA
jgi:hypothetical protein